MNLCKCEYTNYKPKEALLNTLGGACTTRVIARDTARINMHANARVTARGHVSTNITHTWSKSSLSCLSDSPTHLLRQSAPFLMKKATFLSPILHSLARARATSVLPVPVGAGAQ